MTSISSSRRSDMDQTAVCLNKSLHRTRCLRAEKNKAYCMLLRTAYYKKIHVDSWITFCVKVHAGLGGGNDANPQNSPKTAQSEKIVWQKLNCGHCNTSRRSWGTVGGLQAMAHLLHARRLQFGRMLRGAPIDVQPANIDGIIFACESVGKRSWFARQPMSLNRTFRQCPTTTTFPDVRYLYCTIGRLDRDVLVPFSRQAIVTGHFDAHTPVPQIQLWSPTIQLSVRDTAEVSVNIWST